MRRTALLLLILTAVLFAAVETLYLTGTLDRWIESLSSIDLFGAEYVR